MIVVADTSPLNYLVLIEQIHLLPALFDRILIPQTVAIEMEQNRTPALVRTWLVSRPAWLEIHTLLSVPANAENLGAGEDDAIQLAYEQGIAELLMDDAKGRTYAESRGINVTGTIGILKVASLRGLVDFDEALSRLMETNFRLSRSVRQQILKFDRS